MLEDEDYEIIGINTKAFNDDITAWWENKKIPIIEKNKDKENKKYEKAYQAIFNEKPKPPVYILDKSTTRILSLLFAQYAQCSAFKVDKSYKITLKGKIFKVTLGNIIVRKNCEEEGKERFYIIEKEIVDDGGFAVICNVLGTLEKRGKKFVLKTYKRRIVKIIDIKEGIDFYLQEVDFIRQMPWLHGKELIISNHAVYCIQKKVGDENLLNFINRKGELTLKQLFYLSISFLENIKYIHEKKISHLDIKPENIVLGFKQNTVLSFIIDFGLSKKLGKNKTGKVGGTLGYCDPIFLSPLGKYKITAYHDVFSASQILMAFFFGCNLYGWLSLQEWKDEEKVEFFTQWQERYNDVFNKTKLDKEYFNKIFKQSPKFHNFKNLLNNEQEINIKKLLFKMYRVKPQERITIEETIVKLYDIYLEDKSEDIKFAHKAAYALKLKLYTLRKYHCENDDEIIKLEKIIAKYLDKCPDTQAALFQFVETLGVKAFRGVYTKENIQERLVLLIKVYYHRKSELQKLDTPESRQALAKAQKYPLTIDGLCKLNKRFKWALDEILFEPCQISLCKVSKLKKRPYGNNFPSLFFVKKIKKNNNFPNFLPKNKPLPYRRHSV